MLRWHKTEVSRIEISMDLLRLVRLRSELQPLGADL